MKTSIEEIEIQTPKECKTPNASQSLVQQVINTATTTTTTRPVRTHCANQPARSGYVVPPSYETWYLAKQPPPVMDTSWIYDIKYLSLSGGGTKGYAYLGAILTLDRILFEKKRNLYMQLQGASGTSIGAMFALFVVLGVRGHQLAKEVFEINIMDSMKHLNFQNLMDTYGLCPTTMFQKATFDLLERRTGKGDVTFQELYDITQKHYVCTLTNVNTGIPEYHSHLSTPNYKIYESVAASMCVPLLFAPCVINNQYYVDGGLSDNCPFSVFPIEDTFIINLATMPDPIGHVDISSLQLYIMRLIRHVCEMFDIRLFERIPAAERKRVLKITFVDFNALDLNVDIDLKKKLAKFGANAVEKFIHVELANQDAVKICVKLVILFVMGEIIVQQQKQQEQQEPQEQQEEQKPQKPQKPQKSDGVSQSL